MTKLPLKFLQGLKAGTVVPGEKPGEELVVIGMKRELHLWVPPECLVAYTGTPPTCEPRVDPDTGRVYQLVTPAPGTFAIVTLTDPGIPTRVYLIAA
jgi:hypothetical protein